MSADAHLYRRGAMTAEVSVDRANDVDLKGPRAGVPRALAGE
jgi:hypothetical protein